MMTSDMGKKITTIELSALTPEDEKKAGEVQEMPNGSKTKLAPKPYKKLVIKIETVDGDNHMTSTSEAFVAEKDGKLVIATPAAAK